MTVSISRREMLNRAGLGFGSIALSSLLSDSGLLVAGQDEQSFSSLAPRQPHFPPKVKRVIHLFMNGGPSQVDTFDPKPELEKYHGKQLLGGKFKNDKRIGGAAFASPFKF